MSSVLNTFRWDIIIIVLALYNSITIPLSIAFQEPFLETVGIVIFDSFVDLVFFIDLFINFRTSYISTTTGEEIFDPKMIAKRYIRGRFLLDLLSTIPFDKLASNSDILPIFGMLKLFRVFRISMVIRNLTIKSSQKSMLKVLWLIFGLFLYLHVLACLWYYLIKDSEAWMCNFDFVFGGSQYLYEVYTGSFIRRYLRCFYIAFYIIAIGEIVPKREVEIFIISCIMLALMVGPALPS